MKVMLKKMFSQFAPNMYLLIPMTVMTILLKMTWLLFMKKMKWLPTRLNSIIHYMLQTSVKTMFQQTKPNTAPWILPIFGMFLLILPMKMMGLLPYAFTSTSHMSITYSLGMPFWTAVKVLGFYMAFKTRLSHLVPQGTPTYLMPLMVMMETMSLFAQPMALGLRLAANLTAGHLLMFLLSTTMWTLLENPFMAIMTSTMFLLLFMLEMGVACIQAYVFTSLTKFYLKQNM